MVNQYKLCEILGRGAYGTVHRAETDGKSYAMKCISKKRLKRKGFGSRPAVAPATHMPQRCARAMRLSMG